MQSFFKKKEWRGEGIRRHFALSSSLLQFLKVSSLTFVVQTMVFQAKLPSHCVFKVKQNYLATVFLKSYNIPNCFNPELQSHVARNIEFGDKFVTNL